MFKYIFISLLLLSSFARGVGQNSIDLVTNSLIEIGDYQEIIDKYGGIPNPDYSYQTLYNIGLSYYILENDTTSMQYMNLAIAKDSTQTAPYYIKGSNLANLKKYAEAIPLVQKAINIEAQSEKRYSPLLTLAYCYLNLDKIDLAIDTYQQAISLDEKEPFAYLYLAQLYIDKGDDEKAINYYKIAKEKCLPESEGYISILFNLGLLQQINENYSEAEAVYKELLNISPDDYRTYSKLIQIYNKTQEYDKIQPLKDILYTAHDKGKIEDEDMSDMFCIDQFKVNEHRVMAFERYESGKKDFIYNKIVFYILDDDSNILYRIQTEYSPPLVSMGRGTYMLCGNVGNTHLNYGIVLDDDTKYSTIKEEVIDIVEGKIEEVASFTPNK